MKYILIVFVVVAALIVGCSNPDPPSNASPAAVNIESLWRVHRDSPDLAKSAWGKRRIRVVLRKSDYRVKGYDINWHADTSGDAPVVVFHCDRPLLDNEKEIEITGICKGRTHDGIKRNDEDLDWHVSINECTYVFTGISSRP